MSTVHVILSIRSSLAREAVRQELEQHDDIRVVADVSSPFELLYITAIEHADAVVLESDERSGMPPVLSHLFGEFPQIVAVVIANHSNRALVYRQKLCEQIYEGASLADILTELRTADTEYWARADGGRGER